jgi:N6-L-threonylcarbamoyladenine synthase
MNNGTGNLTQERIILGIETSCDDTAAAVVLAGGGKRPRLLGQVISSQAVTHGLYGGVVPEIASREHALRLGDVIAEALRQADVGLEGLAAVAVTYGPGLVGSLLVGVAHAKALAFGAGLPLIAVNHLAAHIYANFLESEPELPLLVLLVSGGHTYLIEMRAHLAYNVLGQTRDDAAGEAFDKIARALGLGYPGGPLIAECAAKGSADAYAFPRAQLEAGSLDFSFSGLKSAVLNVINTTGMKGEVLRTDDVAASLQEAIVDILAQKTTAALRRTGLQNLALAGGVSANLALRQRLRDITGALGVSFTCPQPLYCTDNAAMVALCGHYHYEAGDFADSFLNAIPALALHTGEYSGN